MLWRKELLVSDVSIDEKSQILRKKREKRDYISALTMIVSFFGSLIVSLVLISFNVLGKFPKSAAIGIAIWLGWSYLIESLVNVLRFFLLKRDEKIWGLIQTEEDIKRVLRK